MLMDFFLENGKINIALTKNNDSATGTANNDAYQEIRNKINALNQKAQPIYESMGNADMTEEQRAENMKALEGLQNELGEVYKEGIEKNITNPVGIHLFKMNYYSMETAENDALLQQIPAQFQNDAAIVKIKEMVEKQKKTAVGQKFIDFEMQTPDGKSVKLSDYAGKGKVVLVDFWASWCGPCRREMPNLVEAYAKYKGKNFEIVGVSLDQNADSWKEAIKTLKMTWPQMSDLKYWNSEGAQLYAVNSIPHTMLIDGEGTIIARGLHGEELQTVGILIIPPSYDTTDGKILEQNKSIKNVMQYTDSLQIIHGKSIISSLGADFNIQNIINQHVLTIIGDIVNIITRNNMVAMDFADINWALKGGGLGFVSSGIGKGRKRIENAIQDALKLSLRDGLDISEAKRLLLNFTYGKEEMFLC